MSEEERGYRLATEMLLPDGSKGGGDREPFAVFAADAPILAGVWRAVEDRGGLDDRVAFACFDEPFLRFPPAVYAVKVLQPFAEIGRRSVGMLKERMAAKKRPEQSIQPERVFVAREMIARKV